MLRCAIIILVVQQRQPLRYHLNFETNLYERRNAMTFPTELKKITVRSIPTEKSRARERTYDAQILVLGDFVDFYITSATKRDIQNRDHLKLEDIGFVACDGRTFLVKETSVATVIKSKYPVLRTTLIA